MFLYSAEGKKVSLSFESSVENVKLGDFFKISNGTNGVISLITNIKINENTNIAEGLIIKSVINNTQWTEWSGNTPLKNYKCEKITQEELLKNSTGINNNKTINLGFLTTNNQPLGISLNKIDTPFIFIGDINDTKTEFLINTAKEIATNGKKAVIIDTEGIFESENENSKLTGGKNFKLPLNSNGIQVLYEKTLNTIPAKTKAVIEDVLMHVQDYSDKSDLGFVPFASFKGVVENEYKNSNINELVLLKNQLVKLEKQGIFGNTRREIHSFKNLIEKENLIIIDLSELPEIWHTEFINYIINTGLKENTEFNLFLNKDNLISEEKMVNQLLNLQNRGKITPFIAISYKNQFCDKFIANFENIIILESLFANDYKQAASYTNLLNRNSAIIYGEITNYTPLPVNIEKTIEDQILIQQETPYEQPKINLEPEIKEQSLPFIQTQLPEEDIQEATPFENETIIEEDSDFAYQQVIEHTDKMEKEYTESSEESEVFDEFEEYSLEEEPHEEYQQESLQEDINFENNEYIQEEPTEEEINPYELDDSFDDIDISSENIESSFQEEILQQTPYEQYNPEISSEVDSLYTGKKTEYLKEQHTQPSEPFDIPSYPVAEETEESISLEFNEGERINHDKYGSGTIKKIINYGNKKLLSIQFDEVGRRLLDPQLTVIRKA